MIRIEKIEDGVKLVFTGSAADLAELKQIAIDEALETALEDELANGWSLIPPEEIGALTAAIIISDDVTFDDAGNIIEIGSVYANPDYQIQNEIKLFETQGYCIFKRYVNE